MSVNEVKLQKADEAFVVKGTGPATSRTFCIGDEDHTLGNSLRHVLIRNHTTGFAGYSVPHPAEPVVQIRVQTVAPPPAVSGGTTKPEAPSAADALKVACQTLSDQCDIVLGRLEELLPEAKDDRIELEKRLLEEGYDDGNEDDDEDDDRMMS